MTDIKLCSICGKPALTWRHATCGDESCVAEHKREKWRKRNAVVSELRNDPVAGEKIRERERIASIKKREKNKVRENANARKRYRADPRKAEQIRTARIKRFEAMSDDEKLAYLERKRAKDREARARRIEKLKQDPDAWRAYKLKQLEYKAAAELRKAQAALDKLRNK